MLGTYRLIPARLPESGNIPRYGNPYTTPLRLISRITFESCRAVIYFRYNSLLLIGVAEVTLKAPSGPAG